MTHLDTLSQILHEVSGKPLAELRNMMEEDINANGSLRVLHTHLPPQEGEALLAELREEKEGILAWMVRFVQSGAAEQERMLRGN